MHVQRVVHGAYCHCIISESSSVSSQIIDNCSHFETLGHVLCVKSRTPLFTLIICFESYRELAFFLMHIPANRLFTSVQFGYSLPSISNRYVQAALHSYMSLEPKA
jgi:hypothetical protein